MRLTWTPPPASSPSTPPPWEAGQSNLGGRSSPPDRRAGLTRHHHQRRAARRERDIHTIRRLPEQRGDPPDRYPDQRNQRRIHLPRQQYRRNLPGTRPAPTKEATKGAAVENQEETIRTMSADKAIDQARKLWAGMLDAKTYRSSASSPTSNSQASATKLMAEIPGRREVIPACKAN